MPEVAATIDPLLLRHARIRLAKEKTGLQEQLSEINVQLKVRVENVKFVMLQRRRKELLKRMSAVDSQLSDIKLQMVTSNAPVQWTDEERESRAVIRRQIVEMIRDVRDKWQELSCRDDLVGPTERTQASQFVRDLNPIIRILCER